MEKNESGKVTELNVSKMLAELSGVFKTASDKLKLIPVASADSLEKPVWLNDPVKKDFADIKNFKMEEVVAAEEVKPKEKKVGFELSEGQKMVVDKIRDNYGRVEVRGKLYKLPVALLIGGQLVLPPEDPTATDDGKFKWSSKLLPLVLDGNIVTSGIDIIGDFEVTTTEPTLAAAIELYNSGCEDSRKLIVGYITDFASREEAK